MTFGLVLVVLGAFLLRGTRLLAFLQERLVRELGAEPGGSTAEAFKALVDKDVAKWGKVVRDAKISLD